MKNIVILGQLLSNKKQIKFSILKREMMSLKSLHFLTTNTLTKCYQLSQESTSYNM